MSWCDTALRARLVSPFPPAYCILTIVRATAGIDKTCKPVPVLGAHGVLLQSQLDRRLHGALLRATAIGATSSDAAHRQLYARLIVVGDGVVKREYNVAT